MSNSELEAWTDEELVAELRSRGYGRPARHGPEEFAAAIKRTFKGTLPPILDPLGPPPFMGV